MIKISDFNSVLQVAFGLNVLFYAFDLVPQTESQIRELEDKHHELVKKKIELTKNSYVFPIGFVVSSTYPAYKYYFLRLSFLISVVILGFMFYDSFYPDARLATFWIWVLLLPSFIVPWIAIFLHSMTIKMIEASISNLEKEIQEAQTTNTNSTKA